MNDGPQDPTPDMPPEPGPAEPAPIESAPVDAAPVDAPTKKGPRIALVVGIVVVALAAAIGAGAFLLLRGAPESVLDKVPASADVVFVAHLDPAASQKMNLFRMAEKFPALGSEEELRQRLNDALDSVLADTGMTHADLAWVGGEAGGYVDVGSGTPSFAIMVATDDEAAASAAMQRMRDASHADYSITTIDGIEVAVPASSDQPATAIVDGVAVIASDESAMRSVIATDTGAASIESDPVFQGVSDRMPEDNLGFVFVNVRQLLDLANLIPGAVEGLQGSVEQLAAAQGLGFAVTAGSDGIALDAVTTTDPSKLTQAQRDALAAGDGPNETLALVPPDAYAVMAVQGVVSGLETSVGQVAQLDPAAARMIAKLHLIGPKGLLGLLSGDLGVQVGPGSGLLPVGGTVLIGTNDGEATQAWLDAHLLKTLGGVVPGLQSATKIEDYNGVTITYAGDLLSGVSFAYGVVNDTVVIGPSVKSVEEAVDLAQNGGGIATDADYSAATDGLPGTESLVYLDVQGILTAVQNILPGQAYQDFLDQGGENLQPITVVVAGSESDEQGSSSRLLIGIP
jgi:hypothetical protein